MRPPPPCTCRPLLLLLNNQIIFNLFGDPDEMKLQTTNGQSGNNIIIQFDLKRIIRSLSSMHIYSNQINKYKHSTTTTQNYIIIQIGPWSDKGSTQQQQQQQIANPYTRNPPSSHTLTPRRERQSIFHFRDFVA